MFLPVGVGLGICHSALAMTTQQASCPTDYSARDRLRMQSIAMSLNPFVRSCGQAFGVSISHTIFTNRMHSTLPRLVIGKLAVTLHRDSTSIVGGSSELTTAVISSLKVVWWTMFALAGLSLVLVLLAKEVHSPKPEKEKDIEKADTETQTAPPACEVVDGSTLVSAPATPMRPPPAAPMRLNRGARSLSAPASIHCSE